MYVCLCNCFKETDMASAIAAGAKCASEVYKNLGCKPQCGKCVPYVRQSVASPAASVMPAAATAAPQTK